MYKIQRNFKKLFLKKDAKDIWWLHIIDDLGFPFAIEGLLGQLTISEKGLRIDNSILLILTP